MGRNRPVDRFIYDLSAGKRRAFTGVPRGRRTMPKTVSGTWGPGKHLVTTRLSYDVGFHCGRGREMFDWAYIDGNGETTGSSEKFETQEAAEAWVGEAWEGLVELGVAEMTLRDVNAGSDIYRMGLSPE